MSDSTISPVTSSISQSVDPSTSGSDGSGRKPSTDSPSSCVGWALVKPANVVETVALCTACHVANEAAMAACIWLAVTPETPAFLT
jgi:hypothetical protein